MEYDPHNLTNWQVLAYVYVPIVQRECEVFVGNWNIIRNQENLEIPTGVPNHIFNFQEKYGETRVWEFLWRMINSNLFDFIDDDITQQCVWLKQGFWTK
jgi:hypothetical protein